MADIVASRPRRPRLPSADATASRCPGTAMVTAVKVSWAVVHFSLPGESMWVPRVS